MIGFSVALLATWFATAAAQESHLVSKRFHGAEEPAHGLAKRFIDDNGNLNISIIHTNDIHAHLDEFRSSGGDCREGDACFGGYARIKAKVAELRGGREEDTLLLDAGDQFQGTMFYSYYKGEKIAETINQLGYDAATIGNHEFDDGDDLLAAYLANLTFPIICANIETDNKALAEQLVPYQTFPQFDLAIVSVTTPTTKNIASPGKNTNFLDPVETVQRTVDEIKSKENVTRIIALTHIGYDEDIKLAKATKGVSLIIGGHSHTPLGNNTGDVGPYPTIEINADGDEVFIVTAWRWGQYLGHIDVAWDPSGKIVAYTGGPIVMDNTTSVDADLDAQIKEWRGPFEAFAGEVIGQAEETLGQGDCQQELCGLGAFMTDAMLEYRLNSSASVDGAIINSGGVRSPIEAGNITRGDVLNAFPFGNAIVDVQFTGQELIDIFEGIASKVSQTNGKPITSFLQISHGINMTYNPSAPAGSRLIDLQIGQPEPAPVQLDRTYTLVTLDFLAGGGDNFFEKEASAVLDTQADILISYIAAHSPVSPTDEIRISQTDSTESIVGAGGSGGNNAAAGGLLAYARAGTMSAALVVGAFGLVL